MPKISQPILPKHPDDDLVVTAFWEDLRSISLKLTAQGRTGHGGLMSHVLQKGMEVGFCTHQWDAREVAVAKGWIDEFLKSLGLSAEYGRAADGTEGTERLAINLFDLDRIGVALFKKVLAGRIELDRAKVIRVDPDKPEETALPFTCPLLTAATAADILRMENYAAGDVVVRIYVWRGKVWSRVPAGESLTVVGDAGKCRLNPAVFSSAVVLAPSKPLLPKKVF